MGNFLTSSIGKKVIMSITGLFLILFLLVHLTANSAYLIGPDAFDSVVKFMGSPVVLVMVPILTAGFIVHIIYAGYLTLTNMGARGSVRYAVSNRGRTDSWASKNMFVLGVVIVGLLGLHLTHFWAKMQLRELTGGHPENGNLLLEQTFGNIWILLCYLVWFVAIWLHLTHGFWSAFQTVGLSSSKWLPRLKVLAYIFATAIMLGFCTIAITAFLRAG